MSVNTGFIPSLSNVTAGATAAQKKRDDASKDIFNDFSLELQRLFDLTETAPQEQRDNLLLNLTGALKQINNSGTSSEAFKAVGSAPQVASSPAQAQQQQSPAPADSTADAARLSTFEDELTKFVLDINGQVIQKGKSPDVAATLNGVRVSYERKLKDVQTKLDESVPKTDVQAKVEAIVDATVDGTGTNAKDKKLLNREDTDTVRTTARELLDLSKPKPTKP